MCIPKDTAWKNSVVSQKQHFTSSSEPSGAIPLMWEKLEEKRGVAGVGGTCGTQALLPM